MSLCDSNAGRPAETNVSMNIHNNQLSSLGDASDARLNTLLEILDSSLQSLQPASAGCSLDDDMSALAADLERVTLDSRRSNTPSSATPSQDIMGTYGHWIIAFELPRVVLSNFCSRMPVQSVHQRLADMIPCDEVLLAPYITRAPNRPTSMYFRLLDLRDRLWAESKVLELETRRQMIFPRAGPEILEFVRRAIDRVSDGLLLLETAFPDHVSDYLLLQRRRFLLYNSNHPLRLIQPYLVPLLPPMPDYTLVERAAIRRMSSPFKNVPSVTLRGVAAY